MKLKLLMVCNYPRPSGARIRSAAVCAINDANSRIAVCYIPHIQRKNDAIVSFYYSIIIVVYLPIGG